MFGYSKMRKLDFMFGCERVLKIWVDMVMGCLRFKLE